MSIHGQRYLPSVEIPIARIFRKITGAKDDGSREALLPHQGCVSRARRFSIAADFTQDRIANSNFAACWTDADRVDVTGQAHSELQRMLHNTQVLHEGSEMQGLDGGNQGF